MEHIGIDVHKTSSQVCILTADGEMVERRIKTERESFAQLLSGRPPARILLEASTESEWVARCLEQLGHEVIVADPNFAPMYATRDKKIKTDKRDARAPGLGVPTGSLQTGASHLGQAASSPRADQRTGGAGQNPRSLHLIDRCALEARRAAVSRRQCGCVHQPT